LKTKSRTIFKLRNGETGWKIAGPKKPPHVSLGAALTHLRKLNNPDHREALMALEALLAERQAGSESTE
jgi:hypothetical protein